MELMGKWWWRVRLVTQRNALGTGLGARLDSSPREQNKAMRRARMKRGGHSLDDAESWAERKGNKWHRHSLSLLPLERQIKDSGRASRMRDDVQPTGKRREETIRFVLRLFPSGGGPAVVQQTLCPFSRGVVGLESTQPLSFDWSTWAARACGATRELQLPPPSPPGRCKGTGGERER